MKNLPKISIPGANLAPLILFGFLMLLLPGKSNGFYAHVTGPSYTCPNSELIYHTDDDYGCGHVEFTITNGQIFNDITQTWVTYWAFDRSVYNYLNSSFPFRIKWNNSAIGTIGNVHLRVCDCSDIFCSNGNKSVTFGASPGTPIIYGVDYLFNCIDQQQSYTPVSIPESWQLASWNYSSNIQSVNGTLNPKTVKAVSTNSNEMATLTGVFNFTTNGITCATQNVNKSIWLGKPGIISQVVDGSSYYAGYQICPGNHWAGVAWNGPVTSTSWSVTSGISYYSNNTTCNFTLPSSGYSSVAISVNATNTCGTSSNSSFYLTKKAYGCGSFLISVSPNPSSEDLTVTTSVLNEADGTQYNVVADGIELLDDFNSKLITRVPTEATLNLDTRHIRNGTYYLHIRYGEDIFVKRIIIKK